MEKPTRDQVIGANVVKLRGDRSQVAIADAMREKGFKWAQATVWNVEKGERPLRLAEAEALALVLGVELVDLLRFPQWYSFFDAQIAVERAEERMLAEANQVDQYLGILARAADALASEIGEDAVAEELGPDWHFDESPIDKLRREWRGRRHGKPNGKYSAEYLKRPELLHPGVDDGEHQTEA